MSMTPQTVAFSEPIIVPREIGTIAYSPEPATGELRLRLVVHSEIPDDAALRQEWTALVRRLDRPQVFYTWEWALAVQHAYHAVLHPLLFLSYDDHGSLRGVVALATDPKQTQVTFLTATTGDYCDFLSSREDKPAFVSAVLTELRNRGLDNIVLTNLPADSGSLEAIELASAAAAYHCFSRTAYVCAQVSLAALERKPGENRPVLPRKKMLRRFLNAMGRSAPVRLDHARSWDTVETALPEFFRSHVARFLDTGLISNIVRPERQMFLRELAKQLCERGWLTLTRMMSGENVYAWNYGFQFQDTWFWYQPTFDGSLEKYSPGFCLLAKLIEEAADNKDFKTIDLGLGAEEYKDRFSNESRETLCVTPKTSAVQHYREVVRYYLSAAVRVWPTAERAARSAMARIQAFRQRFRSLGVRQGCAWVAKRAQSALVARDEVFFYELSGRSRGLQKPGGVFLRKIDLKTLAIAAMQNADDEGTLAYVLRCAERLRTESDSAGFALTNDAGEFLHFTWAGPFESFHWSELNSGLPAPAPDSVILFDSWTPVSQRGRGYYAPTLELVVSGIQQQGKRAWGFSASTNTSSVRGLEKAGFQRGFSVLRYRMLWWQKLVQRNVPAPGPS